MASLNLEVKILQAEITEAIKLVDKFVRESKPEAEQEMIDILIVRYFLLSLYQNDFKRR